MKLHTPVSLSAIACACWLCLLSACGGSANSPSVATPPPPDPRPTIRHTIHGEVFSFETGVIPGANVNLAFWLRDIGYSEVSMRADGLGQFEVRLTEEYSDSSFRVLASLGGFVQPCVYRGQVDGEDIAARVEMIPVASLNAVNPPRPQLSSEPSVTGTIFENTPNGRVAVAGATVQANEWFIGFGEEIIGARVATTVSDLAGGLYMCNLPAYTVIYVGKNGYKSTRIGPIDATEPVVLEVALERETP